VDPGFIVDLLTALGQINEALVGRATNHILAWPKLTASMPFSFRPFGD